jgi:hypothetical protein
VKYIVAFGILISTVAAYAQHVKEHVVVPTNEIQIIGSVKKSVQFNVASLLTFKQDALGDLVVKNKRGEEKGVAKKLKGVLLKTLLDSAGIVAGKPKEYSEYCIILVASDGYRNVYSWNEVFNNEVGDRIYVVTEMDGKSLQDMPERIEVISLSDINTSRRHLKGLARIKITKPE